MLNGETRRAPMPPPDGSDQMAWEDQTTRKAKRHMELPKTTLGQISIPPGQTDPHPGKKEKN
jgi:hypothetical protein